MYNKNMKTISTTEARKKIGILIGFINETNGIIAIGRRDKPEAILMKYPSTYDKRFSDVANINAFSGSFDFLKNEPEIYTANDLKKKNV